MKFRVLVQILCKIKMEQMREVCITNKMVTLAGTDDAIPRVLSGRARHGMARAGNCVQDKQREGERCDKCHSFT